jgi:hypothetical protein
MITITVPHTALDSDTGPPGEVAGYRPSRRLRHLIRARNMTCTAPGYGRRATSCDLDHTDPHHLGGRTCECNLAPQCKR